jgi:hypothetical protein
MNASLSFHASPLPDYDALWVASEGIVGSGAPARLIPARFILRAMVALQTLFANRRYTRLSCFSDRGEGCPCSRNLLVPLEIT